MHVLLVHLFFLLGEKIDPQSVDLLEKTPEVVSSTASILRLWDDLGSAKVSDKNIMYVSFLTKLLTFRVNSVIINLFRLKKLVIGLVDLIAPSPNITSRVL